MGLKAPAGLLRTQPLQELIQQGRVVAVRGIGGFLLAVLIAFLRELPKMRPGDHILIDGFGAGTYYDVLAVELKERPAS